MVNRNRKTTPAYRIWLEAEVHETRNLLPGKVRQQVKRLISELGDQPRPAVSRTIDTSGLDVPAGVETLRIRPEKWRIIYAVNDSEKWAWVLAIRKRPPYEYEDLPELMAKLTALHPAPFEFSETTLQSGDWWQTEPNEDEMAVQKLRTYYRRLGGCLDITVSA